MRIIKYSPSIVILITGGIILGLPTLDLGLAYKVGGGPVREFVLNEIILPILPNFLAIKVADLFIAASATEEYFLTLIGVVFIALCFYPIGLLLWKKQFVHTYKKSLRS